MKGRSTVCRSIYCINRKGGLKQLRTAGVRDVAIKLEK